MTLYESKHVALNNKITYYNFLYLTDALYIHIYNKHFGMANINKKLKKVTTVSIKYRMYTKEWCGFKS